MKLNKQTLAFVLLLSSCASFKDSESFKKHWLGAESEGTTETVKPEQKVEKPKSSPFKDIKSKNWNYSTSKDELDGSASYIAEVISTNTVHFRFPYQGGSKARVTILKKENSPLFIAISISKGQFSFRDGEIMRVKFDNDPVGGVVVSPSNNGNFNIIGVSGLDADLLIAGIKRSKKMKLELSFYEYGNETFDFNVGDLQSFFSEI